MLNEDRMYGNPLPESFPVHSTEKAPTHSSVCLQGCEIFASKSPFRPIRPFSSPLNATVQTSPHTSLVTSRTERSLARPSSTPPGDLQLFTGGQKFRSNLSELCCETQDELTILASASSDYVIDENRSDLPVGDFTHNERDTSDMLGQYSALSTTDVSLSHPNMTVTACSSNTPWSKFHVTTASSNSIFSPDTNDISDYQVTTKRSQLKRPHSAMSENSVLSTEDVLSRPLSAPKRLLEYACDPIPAIFGNCIGFPLETDDISTTPVVEEQEEIDSSDPPKSTLEALVASDSPLLFFPTGYSVEATRESAPLCDILARSPDKTRSSVGSYEAGDTNYTLDLEVNQSAFLPADFESDILNMNSANSVSSSKSLGSVDLGEMNAKGTDSHSVSPKSNLSEMGASTDTILNGPNNNTSSHLSAFVEAMRSYADELCPVDCVILVERCRPFNCDTLFMRYFREQYLCPILSNLNGGPPLNADFGRDAYTSLYSLHGFYWRKPHPLTSWVPDTPIIYRILKRITTLQHEERHASEQFDVLVGTSGRELLESANEAFDAIDRARRGLCKQVQRHLLLLSVSPINLSDLHKELVSPVENRPVTGPLTELRQRGVALSAFSPVRSPSLLQLYELVNGVPPSPFYDRRWQTVAFSTRLINSDSPERRVIGPLAADYHAQAEAELMLVEQRQQKQQVLQQQQQPQQLLNDLPHVSLTNGSSQVEESPQIPTSVSPARHAGRLQRHNSQTSSGYGVVHTSNQSSASPMVPVTTALLTEPMYRPASNKAGNSIITGNHSALSPAVQPYQGTTSESPVSQNHRSFRNSGCTLGSTPPSYSSRTMSGRFNADVNRPSEHMQHVSVPSSSLSAGHSGPNSVDQLGPGSVYGSDSTYSTNALTNQLHSPAPSAANPSMMNVSGAMHHNPGSNASYQSYQQCQQLATFDGSLNARPTGNPPSSPSGGQNSFRPPSNAASPNGGQFIGYVNTVGLPSPSAGSRNAARQYSPAQVTPHQQRHTSPHPSVPLTTSQASIDVIKPHHLASPDLVSGSNARSQSLTPTNFPTVNPTNTPQTLPNSYPVKDNFQTVPSTHCNTWMVGGHPQNHPMGAYESQPFRSVGAPGCSDYASPCPPAVTTVRPQCQGFSGPVPVGSNMLHRDNANAAVPSNEQALLRRLESGPHPMSVHAAARRQQLSPLEQSLPAQAARSIIWEGETHLVDSNAGTGPVRLNIRLILEQTGARDISQPNMQLWGHTVQLSIIHVHHESALVRRLTNNMNGGHLLARVLVDAPIPEEACSLVSALSSPSVSPTALTLGILSPPPSTLPTPLPAGAVAFVCLSYNPKRNRVYGLIPSDSEQFRHDLPPLRQFVKAMPGVVCDTGLRAYPLGPNTPSRPLTTCQEEPFTSRSVISSNVSPASFAGTNPCPGYGSMARPSGTMADVEMLSRGSSNHTTNMSQIYPNPQHPSYHVSGMAAAQPTPSSTYLSLPNSSVKGPPGSINTQLTQRSTPSPHRSRDMCGQLVPDTHPPHWTASQAEVSNIAYQSRVIRTNHPQHQQQLLQCAPSQPHAGSGQTYSFQPHARSSADRYTTGAVVTTGGGQMPANFIHQSSMLNEPVSVMDQSIQRTSSPFNTSVHPPQQRFVPNSNAVFQTIPAGIPHQSAYSASSLPSSHVSNASNPGYGPPQHSAFGQRTVYQGQSSDTQHLTSSHASNVGYSTTAPACYQTRSVPTTSLPCTTGYRYVSEAPTSSMCFLPTQSASIGGPNIPKHQSQLAVDTPCFQPFSNRSMNSGIVPIEGSVGAAPQPVTITGGVSIGGHFVASQELQQHHSQSHVLHGSTVYGPVRMQHSTYDGPPGFF
ncbi:hypothetical protein EG68_05291 [Paragonimus skrjabini miyazakii]|uniref:Mediator of RNA polymerase II transcription subunit 25 von Willebrand factor type A domain-containing protein n=1 Tax=Paragonimus skrjabini miyazakii TaxID=59628 RepID=A0A8S9YSZ3_9TREM|nr:hypothetical protein EG68_05291 [Paragonimus skrjabini miyazakii]